MKKVLFSVLALMLAAAMIVSFAACGGNDEPETTTEPAETTFANVQADATTAADETTVAEEPSSDEADATTVVDETTAAEVDETTTAEATTAAAAVAPTAKADIVALYNEATKSTKNAKPGYKKTVTTELQNLEMGAIGKLDMVRDAVGGFLGEGTETTAVSKGKSSDEIKVSTLSAADVTAATCKLSADGKYYEVTLTVKNETNPLKNKSSLNKYTNDYKDINEMHEGLKGEGASAETITCTVKTATIKAKIAVDAKTISALDYTIKIDALLTKVNYVLTVKQATGTIYTVVNYSGFAY